MYLKRTKELRIENKETQEEIAKVLKVQQSSYSMMGKWKSNNSF